MDRFIKIFQVVLISFLVFWVVIWYSARAERRSQIDRNSLDKVVIFMAKVPRQVKSYFQFMSADEHLEKTIQHTKELHNLDYLPDDIKVDESYYLLHYRYLGNEDGVVLLQNIRNGEIAHRWNIPLKTVMNDIQNYENEINKNFRDGNITIDISGFVPKNTTVIRAFAPIMNPDSSLVFHCTYGFMYKIDKHSRLLWKSEKEVHHSIEVDHEGNYWACSKDNLNKFANAHKFWDDAILCVSPDGEEKFFTSLTRVFNDNDLFGEFIDKNTAITLARGVYDPYHINDVLPVQSDGNYWKAGDVFLSLRHQSIVALYRPKADSIIWYQKGPWLMQHDINIINDSIISIFNNNTSYFDLPEYSSNIAYYNFSSGKTTFDFEDLFYSRSNGRQILTDNGDLIIEDTPNSTYYILDSTGSVQTKFYIPYHTDSLKAHYPSWARVYIKEGNQYLMQ